MGRCAQNLTKSLGKSFKSIFSSFFPGPCGLFPERQRFMFLFQKRQRFFINYIVWEGGIKDNWSIWFVRFLIWFFQILSAATNFLTFVLKQQVSKDLRDLKVLKVFRDLRVFKVFNVLRVFRDYQNNLKYWCPLKLFERNMN